MKEILVEITYRQLYGREADDKSTGPLLTFYRDGTYISHNHLEKYTIHWKIDGGRMWILHTYNGPENHKWECCHHENEGSRKIYEIVTEEIVELELLGAEIKV